jgi:adenylate cyclase
VRTAAAGILVGLGGAGIILGAYFLFESIGGGAAANPLQTIELKTYDWRLTRTANPLSARQDIALVEIDEYSLRNLEPNAGRWPWPRVVHSSLVDYLARAKPKLIAYDVDFAEADARVGFQYGGDTWSGAESDQAFADSIKAAGNVLLLANATFEGVSTGAHALPDQGYRMDQPGVVERRTVFPPAPKLAEAAAGFGHNLFVLDADGPIRHTVPFVRSGGKAIPSLGLAAALRAGGVGPGDVKLDAATMKLGAGGMPLAWRRIETPDGSTQYLWGLINFRGPALRPGQVVHTYPTYSMFDLLLSDEQLAAGVKPKVDPAVFRDKLVFVGVTASGLFDVFETPFSTGKMSGIQIHAAVADDVLSNRFMWPESPRVTMAAVLLMALLVGITATTWPAWWATVAVAAGVAAFAAAGTWLLGRGYWLNVTQPTLASSLSLFGGVAYQYFVEGREKRKMKRLFGQYVSKDVYDQLVANPDLARLGGQRRQMTVLFSDIRGFTTVSERGEPEDIVQLLNEYFTSMVGIVFKHRGTIDKFVGDMVMALFGAPLDDPQHAEHAVDAALEMIAELQRLNERWHAEGRPALDIGIGINTGPMIAGNIGSDAIMSYTVIGDAVNLGSRLESLNKQYGTRIIISEATRDSLPPRYALKALGDVVVKGKTRPVAIYEVAGLKEM